MVSSQYNLHNQHLGSRGTSEGALRALRPPVVRNIATISTIGSTLIVSSTPSNEIIWHQVILQDWQDYGEMTTPPSTPISNTSEFFLWPNISNNTTENSTNFGNEVDPTTELIRMVVTSIVLALVILATVIGNVFVIAAILLERNLQNVANYLILSLAVADLLVACLVMPLGAVYEVSREWSLGPELCDMWTSSDVLCCTASILHLVAIATDRYWAVTNIDYIHQRTSQRILCMILVVWFVAFMVCIAPVLGWKDPEWELRVLEEHQCIVSQDLGYQIFATASSFYLPLLVILILYWRIFQTARKRIRRRRETGQGSNVGSSPSRSPLMEKKSNSKIPFQRFHIFEKLTIGSRASSTGGVIAAASGSGGIAAAVVTIIGRPLPTISETTTTQFTTVSSTNSSPEKTSFANGLEPDGPTMTDCGVGPYPSYQPPMIRRKPKDAADSKRERKAAKTLAIITGAFVVCWLPFFVIAVLLPIYHSWPFSNYMISLFLWLGYFNSTLNPIIYTVFSPEFRHAFKKLLCGRRRVTRARHRPVGVRHLQ